jgi:hypothetical protein
MIGKLLSSTVKLVTMPVDIADTAFDIATGGDGSKASRTSAPTPGAFFEMVRDETCEMLEEINE